jgi:hypothetical protein
MADPDGRESLCKSDPTLRDEALSSLRGKPRDLRESCGVTRR